MTIWNTVDSKNPAKDCFVQRQGNQELLRCGDIYFDSPFSPLKTQGLNMLPMTFRGMEMLYHLWKCEKPRFRVLPLSEVGRDGPTLLETMPGVWLRSFILPYEKYKKSYKDKQVARQNREKILTGLSDKTKTGLTLTYLGRIYDTCSKYDDGLDSLVAAIAAALWVEKRETFLEPHRSRRVLESSADPKRKRRISPGAKTMTEKKAAQLEGWIYAPKPVEK